MDRHTMVLLRTEAAIRAICPVPGDRHHIGWASWLVVLLVVVALTALVVFCSWSVLGA